MTHKPIVVLTGGVASGKTTVSDILKNQGVPVVDTDVIAHQLSQPGQAAHSLIVQEWGAGVLVAPDRPSDSPIDRKALRKLVFEHSKERNRLDALLHPLIMKQALNEVVSYDSEPDAPYILLVIPLYAEMAPELRDKLSPSAVVVVDVPTEDQIQRLTKRDGIDSLLACNMVQAQASREERKALATDVLSNMGDLESLHQAVAALHQTLVARFSG